MGEPDVRTLMLRMRRGDEPAAERLWALFAPRLGAYARAQLPAGLAHGADDVVQRVFMRLLSMRRGALREVRDGSALLFRMTRNEALNYGRGELRERARRQAGTARGSGEEASAADDDVRRVLDAISGLVYEQREVLLLRYIGGLTVQQAADSLGIGRNTAASRSRLGIERLREALASKTGSEISEARDG